MDPLLRNLDITPTPTVAGLFHRRRFSSPNATAASGGRRTKRSVTLSLPPPNPTAQTEAISLSDGRREGIVKSAGRGLFGLAAAAAVAFSSTPALSESLTVAFPVSRAREVNTVQRTLVEAWSLIRETFFDPTFNHQDWDLKLQQTMVEMFPLNSADAAYSKIGGMLSTLGDPFTRIISPKEYQSFRVGSDGNLQGVGIFISSEPSTGRLVVLSSVEGSPAARAGIREGDHLIEINGERLDGIDSEAAAQRLRGRAGTSVILKVESVINEPTFSEHRVSKRS